MSRLLTRRVLALLAALGVLVGAGFVAAAAVSGNAGPALKVAAASPARAGESDTAAYEKCLNEHGWPVGPGLSIDPNGTAPAPGVIAAAIRACHKLEHGALAALRPSDDAFQQLRERSFRFRACMSDHGVDIGMPRVFRVRAGIGVGFPGYDPFATGFGDAYAACKPIMDVFG